MLLTQHVRNTGKINAFSFGLRIRRPQVRILPGVPQKNNREMNFVRFTPCFFLDDNRIWTKPAGWTCEVPLEAGEACPVFITGNPAPAERDFTSF